MEAANERAASDADGTAVTPNTAPTLAPAPAATSQNKDNGTTDTVVRPHPFRRIATPAMEFLVPSHLRQEYQTILEAIALPRHAYTAFFIIVLIVVAEYQQPGWFPRPEALSIAFVSISSMNS